MARYDTIVLGLGAMGSAAAYQLTRRDNQVLGIDQFAPPHVHGSTHGDTRITRLAIGEGLHYTPLAVRSHEIWREVERETGRNLLTITGGLIISSSASHANCHVDGFFQNTLAAAEHFNVAHETLDASAIRNRFPQFDVQDDELGYFEPGAGFLRPEECVRANLELAARYGADLHTNEKVLSFHETSEGVEVRTTQHIYAADRLIVSAGPWLPQLLRDELGRHFRVTRQVLYWFELVKNPTRYDPTTCPVFICQRANLPEIYYGFPAVDGPDGGVKVATEQTLLTTDPDQVDRTVSDEEIRTMFETCVRPFLPDLGPRCLKAVTCLYTSTRDSGFVIAPHPTMPRVQLVSPCSGHGFKHSAAIGEALAQLIAEGRSTLDLSHFSLDRLTQPPADKGTS